MRNFPTKNETREDAISSLTGKWKQHSKGSHALKKKNYVKTPGRITQWQSELKPRER